MQRSDMQLGSVLGMKAATFFFILGMLAVMLAFLAGLALDFIRLGDGGQQVPVTCPASATPQIINATCPIMNRTCPSVNPVAPVYVNYSFCPYITADHMAYDWELINYSDGSQACFAHYSYFPAVLGQDMISRSSSASSISIALSKADGHNYVIQTLPCTGSMQPMMGCGNTIITQELLPSDTVNIGDVVGYDSGILNQGLIHQVVAKNGTCYIIKGLSLQQPDGCIDRSQITERLVGIIYTR